MTEVASDVTGHRAMGNTAGDGGGTEHANRLFLGCFASMFATSFAFIVRAMLITEWGQRFGLTEAQKGAIFPGAALFPFAISIVLFSLFIDNVGYGKTMVFAFLGHVIGTVVTMLAVTTTDSNTAYQYLYFGTFITALANGAVEAVINPVTATIYPRNKTHYLNILHAGWPGGLVLAGILSIFLVGKVSWIWVIALVFIPTVIYGIMLFGRKFPVQERVAAGVSYADMMREFGAAGAFLLAWFLTMAALTVASVFVPADAQASSTWIQANNWAPPIVAILTAIVFFAMYKSFGRPMFVFLLLVMILLATTELGTDGWITDLLRPTFGNNAGWILVYTSLIMFVMRFFAGPIVHRINPLGLLCVCAAIAVVGLYVIGSSGGNGWLLFAAASLYGVGKSFFWPTTLGVVSEQFPRGGALTLNAMGGMGMIAVGVLGGDVLGTLVDKRVDYNLQQQAPAIHQVVSKPTETTKYGMRYQDLDQAKLALLPDTQKAEVEAIRGDTKQTTLRIVAILPAIMFVCYVGLIIYFRSRGGYRVQHLEMSGEKAAGGVEGAVR
jgi:MFS family permease